MARYSEEEKEGQKVVLYLKYQDINLFSNISFIYYLCVSTTYDYTFKRKEGVKRKKES